jgi:hypothetical protein
LAKLLPDHFTSSLASVTGLKANALPVMDARAEPWFLEVQPAKSVTATAAAASIVSVLHSVFTLYHRNKQNCLQSGLLHVSRIRQRPLRAIGQTFKTSWLERKEGGQALYSDGGCSTFVVRYGPRTRFSVRTWRLDA